MIVVKRNGAEVSYDMSKPVNAMKRANNEVSRSERISMKDAKQIARDIKKCGRQKITVEEIQDLVEFGLMKYGKFNLAKKYILYRYIHGLFRGANSTDDSVMGIINVNNKDVLEENSNKDSIILSTQRDLIAGEVSKDLTYRVLLPKHISAAEACGILHFHDADYFVQHMHNCFSRDTRFITTNGTISFNDVEDGDIVYVYSHDGKVHRAVVHSYGVQKLNKYTLKRGTYSRKEVFATSNHTWLLSDGTRTTNLKVGDKLLQTPVIEDFSKEDLDENLAYYWCLGFALGDGTDYDNRKYGQTGSYGIRVRLCGDKVRFAEIFERAGFNVTNPESRNSEDLDIHITQQFKKDFLDNKVYNKISLEEKKALFDGYLSADGEFRGKSYATGVSTINDSLRELIYSISETCGYYIGAERTVEGSTNFTDLRTPMHHIQFSREQYYKQKWTVESIEYCKEDEVWCLEVEDTHSFILSGGIVTGNCCLINIQDMLDNGTVINGNMIERPKSFRVACTVLTQIIAVVASHQYGGQSVNIKYLGKYVDISYKKHFARLQKKFGKVLYKKYYDKWKDKFAVYGESVRNEFREFLTYMMNDLAHEEAMDILKHEIKDGVQTIQYQLNTLVTTNGQSPFVTLFLELDEKDPYIDYTAMIIEEIFKQRIQGIKDKSGVYVTPAFPKLIYVLDEHNIFKDGKYDYLTLLAAQCSAKRMVPDYISAKKMREYYDGEVFSCMGCRSFLSPWKKTEEYVHDNNEPESEIGKYKWEGRFNMGVVSINLPQIGILCQGDFDKFWKMLDERIDLCIEALMCRYYQLRGTLSDVSPIHWQYGALARLKPGETIDKLLKDGYATISLGYIGVYEMCLLMTGKSHTSEEGQKFARDVMTHLRERCEQAKKETGLGFGLYGTPAESLCYKFARKDEELYGDSIPEDIYDDIVGKGYYTNSYHVDVREEISAFDKLKFESQFQDISSGGAISYVEVPNLVDNIDAVVEVIKFIYDNIKYAEINTRNDICLKCGFEGEITTNAEGEWECPCCHNKNQGLMKITRRTCGYIGTFYWNVGKTKEINSRVLHL